MNFRKIVGMIAFSSLLAFGVAGYAPAQTPDGRTPAEEQACADLDGALFGLCNAYCEAKDCTVKDADPGCEQILENFENKSGDLPLICNPCVRACTWNGIICQDDAREAFEECIDSGNDPAACKARLIKILSHCRKAEGLCLNRCRRICR